MRVRNTVEYLWQYLCELSFELAVPKHFCCPEATMKRGGRNTGWLNFSLRASWDKIEIALWGVPIYTLVVRQTKPYV